MNISIVLYLVALTHRNSMSTIDPHGNLDWNNRDAIHDTKFTLLEKMLTVDQAVHQIAPGPLTSNGAWDSVPG